MRPAELSVETIALPSQAGTPGFSTGRTDDLARLPVDNTPNTLEPESVAFSHDSRFVFVTLQENSGVVRVDVLTGHLTFLGLGQTTHAADLTVNGLYEPFELLTAFREPDGIAVIGPAGFSSRRTRVIRGLQREAPVLEAAVRSACSIRTAVSCWAIRARKSMMRPRQRVCIRMAAAIAAAPSPRFWTSRIIADAHSLSWASNALMLSH